GAGWASLTTQVPANTSWARAGAAPNSHAHEPARTTRQARIRLSLNYDRPRSTAACRDRAVPAMPGSRPSPSHADASTTLASLAQQLFELETYGFTLTAEVLSATQVDALRDVNERLLASHGEDLVFYGRAGHVINLPTRDPLYFQCIDHPRVLPLLEAAMGRELI